MGRSLDERLHLLRMATVAFPIRSIDTIARSRLVMQVPKTADRRGTFRQCLGRTGTPNVYARSQVAVGLRRIRELIGTISIHFVVPKRLGHGAGVLAQLKQPGCDCATDAAVPVPCDGTHPILWKMALLKLATTRRGWIGSTRFGVGPTAGWILDARTRGRYE